MGVDIVVIVENVGVVIVVMTVVIAKNVIMVAIHMVVKNVDIKAIQNVLLNMIVKDVKYVVRISRTMILQYIHGLINYRHVVEVNQVNQSVGSHVKEKVKVVMITHVFFVVYAKDMIPIK